MKNNANAIKPELEEPVFGRVIVSGAGVTTGTSVGAGVTAG
jgi:hypothetical protein